MQEITVTKYKNTYGELFDTKEEAVQRSNQLCRDLITELVANGNIIVHNYNSDPKSLVPFTYGMTIHINDISTDDKPIIEEKIRTMFYFALMDLNNFGYGNDPLEFIDINSFGKTYKVDYDSDGNLIIDPESLEDKFARLQHELEEATK